MVKYMNHCLDCRLFKSSDRGLVAEISEVKPEALSLSMSLEVLRSPLDFIKLRLLKISQNLGPKYCRLQTIQVRNSDNIPRSDGVY